MNSRNRSSLFTPSFGRIVLHTRVPFETHGTDEGAISRSRRKSQIASRIRNSAIMDSTKAVHLYNLAHYSAFNPFLSRHAIAHDAYACENGLSLPPSYSHCEQCGVYQVPGLTSSARIKYLKVPKKKAQKEGKSAKRPLVKPGPRQRTLWVTCLACQFVKKHNSLITKKKVAEYTPPPSAADANKPGKKKKKKRSELSALLEQKRMLSALPSPLSLMEFMK